MKVLLSWIREFVDLDEPAEAIGARMSLRGLALEGLEPHGDDAVLDFDVAANRPDCLSMVGIAREIAVAFGRPFKDPGARLSHSRASAALGAAGALGTTGTLGTSSTLSTPSTSGTPGTPDDSFPISISDPDLCARYIGGIADVTVAPSPAWLADRLAACGVRPISNIVDITNYVLLEMGQPMHAFDCARLAGPAIDVRRARKGEPLRTLDGRVRELNPDMLVIADAERASAIGGVMGGADSEVSATTTRALFEAAWFLPSSVRATSKALGLKTEASIRFERGADLTAPSVAMSRVGELLAQTGAGRLHTPANDVYPRPFHSRTLLLAHPRVSGLLGMHVPNDDIVRILSALGFTVTRAPGGWSVTVPAWRVDMHRDVDLVEEVGRHFGFEHLPASFAAVEQAPPASDPRIGRDGRVRRLALASGFSEAVTFAFIEARHADPFLGGHAAVTLANPLSEKFAVMRPSLVPGLLAAVGHNRRHGRREVQLFEVGTRFSRNGEARAVALAWTGLATVDHWSGGRRDVDWFDLKGAFDALAADAGVSLEWRRPDGGTVASAVLIDGRSAEVVVQGQSIGWAGQLRSSICDAHDVPAGDAVYAAELDLDGLTTAAGSVITLARPLPRFPAVVRDLAIVVDDRLSAETVRGTIRQVAPDTLASVVEFNRYQGKGIPDGKVSLALRLTFQSSERTLTDAEVQHATSGIVATLVGTLGAVQR